MPRIPSRSKLVAGVVALVLVTLVVPLSGVVLATHPANSCLDVEPESASSPINTQHVLTATLRTLQGQACAGAEVQPAENLTVNFEVTGANDSDGDTPNTPDFTCNLNRNSTQCDGSYTGTQVGTDTIIGWIDHDGNGQLDATDPQDQVSMTWTQAGPPPAPTCPGFENDTRNQVVGTAGDDTLQGTQSDDIICGLGGHDTILGLDGKDLLLGGGGDDALRGGAADDVLRAARGHDALFGDAGNDRLLGGRGRDFLNGGADRDTCRGGLGRDLKARCEA